MEPRQEEGGHSHIIFPLCVRVCFPVRLCSTVFHSLASDRGNLWKVVGTAGLQNKALVTRELSKSYSERRDRSPANEHRCLEGSRASGRIRTDTSGLIVPVSFRLLRCYEVNKMRRRQCIPGAGDLKVSDS
ncbi:hypothetical protein GRJ2_000374400 [Grus japonensis]|uniref:Uncharacterized protein n=1 Tax=Grus japonensis TaxID=30415 RepID=A0ABC9W1T7_GRUJA